MYYNDLKQTGEALFKIRGKYLTATILIGAVVTWRVGALGPFSNDGANLAWFWLSLGVASAGALVRIITSGFAAPGTSGNTKDAPVASELNTTGPYSLVRNPLYVGRILNFTGIAMLSGSWVYGALVFFISVLIYERVSVFEEAFVRKKFPDEHPQWAEEVPFLLPRLRGWVKPKYRFWMRRCFSRENKKLYWLVTAVALFDFAGHGFDLERLSENLFLYIFWAVVAVARLAVRFIRRRTKFFEGIS